jgi:4-hydroxythreonine-4-phosphate dehydrogenase
MRAGDHLPPLALTMGEPAGIGPEITVKSWLQDHSNAELAWLYLGDPKLLSDAAGTIGTDVSIKEVGDAAEARSAWKDAIPVMAMPLDAPARCGHPDTANAEITLGSIRRAVELAATGDVAGIVTNPIQKSVLYDAGFEHPGHTEFLAALSGGGILPVMMLVAEDLRTVPVTVHIPLARVPAALTEDLIVETVLVVHKDLKGRFGIPAPRISLAGLNPHAGEAGALGSEERDIILPAIERLRAAGVTVTDPLPADTMFHVAARQTYDAAVCMYHDQALIPVKTIGFDSGVNCTLGLPFVRTSPDHGTALNIAGQNTANAQSLMAAVRLARELAVHADGQR